MILPPHIIKYQKQLQELNKKSSAASNSSNKNQEKIQNNKLQQKESKGKNKHNNKFLQSKNSSNIENMNITKAFTKENISKEEDLEEEEIGFKINSPKNSLDESETEEEKEKTEEEQNLKDIKNKLSKREEKMNNNWRIYRKGAGIIWQDESLNEWPENDYRIFVGDLGNEVNDQVLANAFIKYPSFAKAKVIRNKITGKTKGYGFVSVTDVNDYIKIMREMNGKYVGNRPIRLKRSTWKDRSVKYSTSKMPDAVFIKKKRNKGEIINIPEITDMKLLKKDPTLGGLLNQIK
jgi:RNA recognition motif-containing protein